jgi:hypothetical protein
MFVGQVGIDSQLAIRVVQASRSRSQRRMPNNTTTNAAIATPIARVAAVDQTRSQATSALPSTCAP